MKNASTITAAVLVFALAACSSEPAEAPEARAETSAPGAITAPAVEPASDTIPAAFHGIWDTPAGDCSELSDARLQIEGGRIVFYETVGTVQSVTPASDGAITVALGMSGEGESWTTTDTLQLSNDGSTLEISDASAEGSDPLIREACAT